MLRLVLQVMRHIHLLEPSKVPREDEFKFRDRAKALMDKWHGILNANKATDGDAAAPHAWTSTARVGRPHCYDGRVVGLSTLLGFTSAVTDGGRAFGHRLLTNA
jgi:hypothetical protein